MHGSINRAVKNRLYDLRLPILTVSVIQHRLCCIALDYNQITGPIFIVKSSKENSRQQGMGPICTFNLFLNNFLGRSEIQA